MGDGTGSQTCVTTAYADRSQVHRQDLRVGCTARHRSQDFQVPIPRGTLTDKPTTRPCGLLSAGDNLPGPCREWNDCDAGGTQELPSRGLLTSVPE